MIVDLQKIPTDNLVLEADLCIVGSGPAGLTLASEFTNTKHKVILLEAGGFDYEVESQEFYEGEVTGRDYPIAGSRFRMFGGTSGHWFGQSGTLPARHLAERPGVVDANWPISYDELVPYYHKANRLLELGNFDYGKAEEKSLAQDVGPSADGPLAPYIWRFRQEGPLRFGSRMKTEMEQAPNIDVFLHANVTKLRTNKQATQLQEIQFSTLSGKGGVASARYFVLACGGLEIPRLLLNTNDIQSVGLGNSRGLVGRYFMEHPNGNIGSLYLPNETVSKSLDLLSERVQDTALPRGSWLPALCLNEEFEREEKVAGGYFRFHIGGLWASEWNRFASSDSSFLSKTHILARFFDEWTYHAYRKAIGHPALSEFFSNNEARIFIEFEQVPNRDSRVFLIEDKDQLGLRRLGLDWRLSEQDIRTAKALGEAIAREAYLRGWGRFKFDDWLLEDGAERSSKFGASNHHIGTVRMGNSPEFGVVDSECRLFDCNNLYIAGSAVFPTGSFVNPTLTIVALAYRIAKDLKERLT